jgi:hypothetical protein
LSGHLLDLEDNELGRFEGRETHQDVDDAQIDVVLGRGLLVALDEVCICLPTSFLSLQLQRIIHFHHRHGATSRSLVRTSENTVKAKFAEFPFHALR